MEEVNSEQKTNFGISRGLDEDIEKFHKLMKKELSEKNYNIYEMLFISKMTEEEVALKLGYKTNEKNRKAGYKQIKNLKKMFKEKAVTVIRQKDIIIINQNVK